MKTQELKNIVLNKNDILESIFFTIKTLKEKIENPKLYTKFDSINDTFNGRMGEIAFEKYLKENYSDLNFRNFRNFNEDDYNIVDGIKYDKYDIYIENKNVSIDIKTQSFRYGLINENYQFGINSKNINKLNDNLYLLLFIRMPLDNLIKENFGINLEKSMSKQKQLEIIENVFELIKEKEIKIELSLSGLIDKKNIKEFGIFINTGENFRIDLKNGNLYSAQFSMNFIMLYQLTSFEEYIKDKKLLAIPNKFNKIELNEISVNMKLSKTFVSWIEKNKKLQFNNEDEIVKISCKDIINNIYTISVSNSKLIKISQFENLNTFFEDRLRKLKKEFEEIEDSSIKLELK